jgi:hypothetical protein
MVFVVCLCLWLIPSSSAAGGTDELNVKPIKFKKVDGITNVFGMVDYGKGKPIIIANRRLTGGDYALASMQLVSKRAKTKKYVQIEETEGRFSNAIPLKMDKKILLFYSVSEEMQESSPFVGSTGGTNWYSYLAVQNLSTTGAATQTYYVLDSRKPAGDVIETSIYPRAGMDYQSNTAYVYMAVNEYKPTGTQTTFRAATYTPGSSSFDWQATVLNTGAGQKGSLVGAAHLPDGNGYVGAVVVQNVGGGSQLVAIVNQPLPQGGYSTQTHTVRTLGENESFTGYSVANTGTGVAVLFGQGTSFYSGVGNKPPTINPEYNIWRTDSQGNSLGITSVQGIDSYKYKGTISSTSEYTVGRVSSDIIPFQVQNVGSGAVSVTNFFYADSAGNKIYQQRHDLYQVDYATGTMTKVATAQTNYPVTSMMKPVGSVVVTADQPIVGVVNTGYNQNSGSYNSYYYSYSGIIP